MNNEEIAILDLTLLSMMIEKKREWNAKGNFDGREAAITVTDWAGEPMLRIFASVDDETPRLEKTWRTSGELMDMYREHSEYWRDRMGDVVDGVPIRPEQLSMAVAITTAPRKRRLQVIHCMRTTASMTLARLANAGREGPKTVDKMLAQNIERRERNHADYL